MFRNATARRIARATRPTFVLDVDTEAGTVSTRRPAKRPARTTVRQAAIRASQLDLTV